MTTARSLADFLAGQAIGVVGLGLIGGSLGLDLRQRGHRVVGVAHRQSTVERALQRGLVDEASSDWSCLNGCGLVLLALPLGMATRLAAFNAHDAVRAAWSKRRAGEGALVHAGGRVAAV